MGDKKYCEIIVGGILFLYLLMTAFIWIIPNEIYMDKEYPYWKQQKDYVHADGDKSEILFLGDSAFKAAVLPNQISSDAYNLALGGGTALEMCYALETYLDHHPKPKAVYVGFGSVHYADIESFQGRTLYFHYLPMMEEISLQFRILSDDTSYVEKPIEWVLDNLQYMMRLPSKYFWTLWASRLERGKQNHHDYERLVQSKGHRLFGTDQHWMNHYHTYERLQKPFQPLNCVDYYMRRMLNKCVAMGIPVNVVQLPIHKLDYEVIQKNGYLADYIAYLDKLEKETGVSVEREIPIYDVTMFGDHMHVNMQGAKRFSQEIKLRYRIQ